MNKDGTPNSARLNIAPGNDLFIPLEVLKQSTGSLKNGISVHVVVESMSNRKSSRHRVYGKPSETGTYCQ